jgi:hypothetical protein
MNPRAHRSAILLAASMAFVGCTHVEGIRYVSIARYDPGEHLVAWPWGPDLQGPDLQGQRPLLTVRFTSDIDLRDYARRHDLLWTGLRIGLCPFDEQKWIDTPRIYHNRVELTTKAPTESYLLSAVPAEDIRAMRAEEEEAGKGAGPYSYEAVFRYGFVQHAAGPSLVEIPIRDRPRDLCFRFEGAAYMWWLFDSNIASVPAADLARALKP